VEPQHPFRDKQMEPSIRTTKPLMGVSRWFVKRKPAPTKCHPNKPPRCSSLFSPRGFAASGPTPEPLISLPGASRHKHPPPESRQSHRCVPRGSPLPTSWPFPQGHSATAWMARHAHPIAFFTNTFFDQGFHTSKPRI